METFGAIVLVLFALGLLKLAVFGPAPEPEPPEWTKPENNPFEIRVREVESILAAQAESMQRRETSSTSR